jgi:hypothetical protein
MKINIAVGDEGGDGHEKNEQVTIESNLTKKELEKTYKKSSKILGFDFCKIAATDYENSEVPIKYFQALRDSGYQGVIEAEEDYNILIAKPKDKRERWERNLKGPSVTMDEYIDIFLFICKLGDPQLKYKIVHDDNDYLHIGGYGLL